MNPESRTMLPKMAFTGFASRYREPTLEEGLADIFKVDFRVRYMIHIRFMGDANGFISSSAPNNRKISGSASGYDAW